MNTLTSLAPVGVIAFALNLLLHLTILCLIVLGVSHWLFRRDPAARHTLCLTGLICLLLAPVAVGLEAKVGFGWITLALPGRATAAPVAENAKMGALVLAPVEKPYRVAISADLPAQPTTAWKGWVLFVAYLLGVSGGVLRFVHGCRTAMRLKRDISPWTAPSDSQTLRTVEQALRAPLPPVFTSPHVASPIAIGLLRPAVILPEGLAEMLNPQQLRHVLLHECAHVAFRHGIGGLLERIAGVLFWPHPLVRALCRELARAREEVCDNFASQEDGAPCYARTLLLVAQGIDIAPSLASTLALLGTGTSLEARISGLLDPRRNRMVTLKRWKLWAVTGAAVVAMGSTAAIRVVAAQEKAGQNPGGVLPAGNSVLRVFPFQFLDASEAAEILYNSVTPEQTQLFNLSVDSRTNSVLVVASEREMVAIAALFAQLEAQAAQERAQQDQIRVLPADTHAQIARQQAEAEAQRAASLAQTALSTQNRVQTGSIPTPQPNAQTRSATAVKPAPTPTVPSKNTSLKVNGKPTRKIVKVISDTSNPTLAEVISKISKPNLQALSTNTTIILKSDDAATVKKLFIQPATPVQTPAQHTTGAPSKTSASVSLQQIDKAIAERITQDQLELRGATVQRDKNRTEKLVVENLASAAEKVVQDRLTERSERGNLARQQAEAIARKAQLDNAMVQTKVQAAEYDRLMSLQMVKEANEKQAELQAARALEEAVRQQVEKNPK